MRKPSRKLLLFAIGLAVLAGVCFAQRTARDVESGSIGTPVWKNADGFERDVFTFARIRYSSHGGSRRGWGRWGGWATDMPDSDLNFSFRLQQMTSMKVDPNGRVIEIMDKELFDYPWIY